MRTWPGALILHLHISHISYSQCLPLETYHNISKHFKCIHNWMPVSYVILVHLLRMAQPLSLQSLVHIVFFYWLCFYKKHCLHPTSHKFGETYTAIAIWVLLSIWTCFFHFTGGRFALLFDVAFLSLLLVLQVVLILPLLLIWQYIFLWCGFWLINNNS